jgi:ketosteroid isomerase-like protein
VSAETLRALFDAFRAGDVDALLRPLHPEIAISDPERVGEGPFVGHDEFLKFMREWMETWDEYEAQLEASVVVDDQTLVAFLRHLGRAAGSGLQLDQRGAHRFRVEDGQIVFWRPYTDRTEALADAGLAEPARWRTAVETLVGGYEAWNRRDFDKLLALLRDVEFVPVQQSPDMPFAGPEGMEKFWDAQVESWEILTFTPLAFEPLGDQMLVEVALYAKARSSGVELRERWGHLYTLRDDEFVRMAGFTNVTEARAALLS